MKLLRRLWAWVLGLFRKQDKPPPVTNAEVREFLMPRSVQAVKSANICLASHTATRRERANARAYLGDIEAFYR